MNSRNMKLTIIPAAILLILAACSASQTSNTVGASGVGTGSTAAAATPVEAAATRAPGVQDHSSALPIPADGITFKDNGKVFSMHPDERFLLNLGMDVYDWTINIDDQAVLSRVINVMPIRGAQGLYAAHEPGKVQLTATGDPLCRKGTPVCGMPSILFKITIVVQ